MKAIILKPIVWSTNEYTRPCGFPSTSGFAGDYGYGHEEWNNKANRIWRDFKLFHTESRDRLLEYSNTGELGIVMIAAHERKQYAIGIATNVFDNNEDDRELISEELNLYDEWEEVWEVNLVKERFGNDERGFIEHWRKQYKWIRWKCPKDQYHHFQKPILLNPERISGKKRLIAMHGSYQPVYPEHVLAFARKQLHDKEAIAGWLSEPDFDDEIISDGLKKVRRNQRPPSRKKKKSSCNSPANRKYEYWVEGNRTAQPRHARLQAKFVKWLSSKNLPFRENQAYVDVKYLYKGGEVFSEVKPTENIETRYAIRAAIGQLLEYQYRLKSEAKLEIVLGSKPKREEIEFVKSLGMALTFFESKQSTFVRAVGGGKHRV